MPFLLAKAALGSAHFSKMVMDCVYLFPFLPVSSNDYKRKTAREQKLSSRRKTFVSI